MGEETKRQIEQIALRASLLDFPLEQTYDEEVKEALSDIFKKTYPFLDQEKIQGKLTVSELKRRSMEMETPDGQNLYEESLPEAMIPDFIEKKELSGAAKGTLMHRFLEHFDYQRTDSLEQIQAQLKEQLQKGYFTLQETDNINLRKVYRFVKSSLGQRMIDADKRGELYREQPFVIGIRASEIDKTWSEEEMILIQGMIDAYFLENGEFVIVDYKTDFAENAQTLYEKYQAQLEYYERALSQTTGCKVKEKILYSFWLDTQIK